MSATINPPLGVTGDARKLYRALARVGVNVVVTKAELIRDLDSRNGLSGGTWTTRRLDSAAVQLRDLLRGDDVDGLALRNVWGVGYRLEREARPPAPAPTIHSSWQRPWSR